MRFSFWVSLFTKVYLLTALRPDKLATPTLRHVDGVVIVTWQSPSNGDVTNFRIECRCVPFCIVFIHTSSDVIFDNNWWLWRQCTTLRWKGRTPGEAYSVAVQCYRVLQCEVLNVRNFKLDTSRTSVSVCYTKVALQLQNDIHNAIGLGGLLTFLDLWVRRLIGLFPEVCDAATTTPDVRLPSQPQSIKGKEGKFITHLATQTATAADRAGD